MDLIRRVTAVTAQGPDCGEASLIGPARHGAGIHVEESRHLTGGEELAGMQVGPGIAPGAHLCVSQSRP